MVFYFTKIKEAYKFSKAYMESNTNHQYHNFRHAKDVVHIVIKLAKDEKISRKNRFLLIIAALTHDLIVEPNGKDNEEKSAFITKYFLWGTNRTYSEYSRKDIDIILNLIEATKLPTNPKNKMEKIICDADVDNLGRKDFFERSEEVRQEIGAPKNKKWYEGLLNFLKSQKYYTKSAQKLRNKGLKENIGKVENLIKNYNKLHKV